MELSQNLVTLKSMVGTQPAMTKIFRVVDLEEGGVQSEEPDEGVSGTPVPRNQLRIPVSPTGEVKDEILFERATDPAQKLYLPRYQLAEEEVSGQRRYRMSMRPDGQKWVLELYLQAYPAPSLEPQIRNAQAIAAQVTVVLNYRWQGQPQSFEFQEVTKRDGEQTLKAVLRVNTLEERDKVYAVLTDISYEAALIVRRKVRVATSLTQLSPADLQRWKETVKLYPEADSYVIQDSSGSNFGSQPYLEVEPLWKGDGKQKLAYVRFNLSSLPNNVRIDSVNFQMTAFAGYAYGGDGNQYTHLVLDDNWNHNSLTWGNQPQIGEMLGSWWTWYGFDSLPPSRQEPKSINNRDMTADITPAVRAKLAGNKKISLCVKSYGYRVRYYSSRSSTEAYRPQLIVTYTPFLYQEQNNILDNIVDDTFFFPPLLYQYIFESIKPTLTGQALICRQVPWKGISYRYYQDASDRYRFYYLPDSFEIGRRSDSEGPTISLSFESSDGSFDEEKIRAILEFYAAPVVDANRLEAAARALLNYAPSPLPSGAEGLEFSPLNADERKLQFSLSIPGQIGSVRNARVSLKDGIFDSLTLSLKDFQAVWDAMFSSEVQNTLLTGQVAVEIPGFGRESIPFQCRLPDNKAQIWGTIEKNVPTTFTKCITLRTVVATFLEIQSIVVDFDRSDAVELTASNLSASVTVRLPISMIFWGQEDPGTYHYKKRVIRKDGQQRLSDWLTTTEEIIYIDGKV